MPSNPPRMRWIWELGLTQMMSVGILHNFDSGYRILQRFLLFIFFLISNKDIYSRNYLMQKNIRQREKYNWKEREKKKKEGKERILIIQEKAKEQKEGKERILLILIITTKMSIYT